LRESLENLALDIKKRDKRDYSANLKYIKEDGVNCRKFLLYSENYLPDKDVQGNGSAFLQSILI